MICPKCFSQMPDGTVFCSACGSSMSTASGAEDTSSYGAPLNSKKGPDKKKIILFAAIGVVALALIIGLITVIAVNSTPEAKVMNAAQKSMKQFEKMLSSSDTLMDMSDNAESIVSKQTFTVNADVTYKSEYSNDADINISLSKDKKEIGASGTVKVDDIGFDFQLYANEKQLVAALPDDLDTAYSVPFENFGAQFADSDIYDLIEDNVDEEFIEFLEVLEPDMFTEPTWKDFKKAYPEEAKALEKSLELKKSKEAIPETDGKMTVYSLELDMDAYIDALVAYQCYTMELSVGTAAFENLDDYVDSLEDQYSALEDVEAVLYIGISGGCITAIHADAEIDGEDFEVTLVFEGDKNIWEEVVLYYDGDDIATLTMEDTGSGFEAELEINDYEFTLECDDSAGELILSVEGEEVFTIEYSAEDKGAQISFEIEQYRESYEISVSILPLQKIEKIDDAQNIFEMSESDIEDVIEDLAEIFDN